MKLILLITLISLNLLSYDKLYFLPKDKQEASNEILELIKNSKHSIDISMYNISYKKFIKQLNKKSKDGIKINIFYTKKNKEFHNDINFYTTKNKMHTKIAIFDKKIVLFGSANWKKESFKENYEVINITNDGKKVKKFNNFFNQLKENNK